jgi:hypothetical protein
MVRMGSPVRFRRGAPPQTSSSGRVQPAACRMAESRQPPLARNLPARFDRFASMHDRRLNFNADRPDVRAPRCLDREPWRAVSLFHPSGRKPVTTMAKGLMTNDGLTEPFSDSRRCTSGCLEPATTGRTGARRQERNVVQQPSRSSQNRGPNRRGRCGSWLPSPRAVHPRRHPGRHPERRPLSGRSALPPLVLPSLPSRWVSAITASPPCVCEEDAACGLQSDAGSL